MMQEGKNMENEQTKNVEKAKKKTEIFVYFFFISKTIPYNDVIMCFITHTGIIWQ
jgi:hypothetical protein